MPSNRSAPPGSAGVPPAKIAAKMAALPGKGRGGLNGYDANTSQGVPVCIYVQHFFLTKGNNKGRSIKPSRVYVPCKII